MELLRSYDMMTDTNAGGIINYSLYNAPNGANAAGQLADDDFATLVAKRFIGGIDFDRFNHSSQTLMSGINTIGNTVNLNLAFNSALLQSANIYAFVMYDVNVKLQGGLLQAFF
jgi:hypothetical protein